MTLSHKLGIDSPLNHVLLPPESKRRIFDRDFTLREIFCDVCKTVLCALLIPEEHEADMIWPFDIICESGTHKLVPKKTEGAAKVICRGKAIQEWEAKKYLEKYI